MFQELDVVTATRDLTEEIHREHHGTVLMVFTSPSIGYLVEFFDDEHTSLDTIIAKEEDLKLLFPASTSHIVTLEAEEWRAKKNHLDTCRVCGYLLNFFPWGLYDNQPSFELCPCCGVQFGVMDETFVLIQQEREEWLSSGTPWFDLSKKPVNWDLETQLAQIPNHYK